MATVRTSQAGVTLIELLISMAIFGVLTTIILIAFIGGRQSQELNAAAQQLAADLRLVQSRAFTGEELDRCSGLGAGLNFGAVCTDATSVTDCGGAGLCGLVPSGGYGVEVGACNANCAYALFADVGNGSDPNLPDGQNTNGVIPDVVLQGVLLPKNVAVELVAVQGVMTPPAPAWVTFVPPKGSTTITPSGSAISICLHHLKNGQRRAVQLTRASGQISATMVTTCPTLP